MHACAVKIAQSKAHRNKQTMANFAFAEVDL